MTAEEQTKLDLDPRACMQLYLEGQHKELAQCFIDLLQKFAAAVYYELDEQTTHFVNVFAKNFLYFFTQPDFLPHENQSRCFVELNPVICNVVAMSEFRTTDAYLAMLLRQPRNFAKTLALYNPRCHTRLNRKVFFDANVELASLWYIVNFTNYRVGSAAYNTWQHLREHMYDIDQRLMPVSVHVPHAYFGVTYIDNERDHELKRVINAGFKAWTHAPPIHNKPDKKKILIVTNMWHKGHSVYRCMHAFLRALAQDYELSLLSLGQALEALDVELFEGRVHTFALHDPKRDYSVLANNEFQLVFFPDIGMNIESIALANLRIAPIQVCGYGHPVSTFGAQIDYWLGGGVETEDETAYETNYDERLVLIPGAGVMPNRPLYERRSLARPSDRIRIGCPWTGQKINYPLLQTLARIDERSERDIIFEFYPSGALVSGGFSQLRRDVYEVLDEHSVHIIGNLHYPSYMAHMETCQLTLDSYPFGGYATATDALFLHRPMVTREGGKFYNRSAASLLRACGLHELITHSEGAYIETAVRLIDDDAFRLGLINRLRSLDLDKELFADRSSQQFKQAITYLIENHQALKTSGDRRPLRFI